MWSTAVLGAGPTLLCIYAFAYVHFWRILNVPHICLCQYAVLVINKICLLLLGFCRGLDNLLLPYVWFEYYRDVILWDDVMFYSLLYEHSVGAEYYLEIRKPRNRYGKLKKRSFI